VFEDVVGSIIAGKYRVERVIGEGAMGMVVAARHVELDKAIALKFMKLEMLANREGVERFLREARAASRLRSEHTCQVHDVGRLDNGVPYIVMELLEGDDLQTLLVQRGQLPVGEAVSYLIEACEALEEAHAAGIVHRDLKPSNLFRARKPNGGYVIKVVDFGVSKLRGAREALETADHMIVGTPSYMAPEQIQAARDVDARADVWSLGVILYQLLAGHLPYPGDLFAVAFAMANSTPPPLRALRPDVPEALEAAILRCLQPSRSDRCAGVHALAAALAPFAGTTADKPFAPNAFVRTIVVNSPMSTLSAAMGQPQATPQSRRRLGRIAGITLAATIVGVLGTVTLIVRRGAGDAGDAGRITPASPSTAGPTGAPPSEPATPPHDRSVTIEPTPYVTPTPTVTPSNETGTSAAPSTPSNGSGTAKHGEASMTAKPRKRNKKPVVTSPPSLQATQGGSTGSAATPSLPASSRAVCPTNDPLCAFGGAP
jgi:serine/threonine-protein kinase